MTELDALYDGIPVTLTVWATALGIGIVGGGLGAAALRSTSRWLRAIAAMWVTVFRGVPPLVLLFLIFFGITIGDWRPEAQIAAVVGLGLVASAYLAEIFRESLDAIPPTQLEAARALGVGPTVTLRHVLAPQAMPLIAAGAGSYAVHLLKDTALASLIGVVEVTYLATYQVERGANGITQFLAVGIVYLVLCLGVGAIARLLGRIGTKAVA